MNSLASPSHPRQMSAALPFSSLRAPDDDLYPRLFDAILEQRIDPSSRFTDKYNRSIIKFVISSRFGIYKSNGSFHIFVLYDPIDDNAIF